MELELNYVLTGEECAQRLGALYIAECKKRSGWNTGRFKRIREKHLKDVPEEAYKEIMNKCLYWYSHGLPKKFVCSLDMFAYWQKVLLACVEYDFYDLIMEEKEI